MMIGERDWCEGGGSGDGVMAVAVVMAILVALVVGEGDESGTYSRPSQ